MNQGFGANGNRKVEGAADLDAEKLGPGHADNIHRMPVQGQRFVERRARRSILAARETVAGDGMDRAAPLVVRRAE